MPNTQKIITLDTLSRFKDHLANIAITGNYGDLEGVPFWIGTQAEYDEQSETIPNNMVIIITDDDGTPIAINYADIANKPQINNNTLVGNLTGADLGLVDAENGKGLSTNDYIDADKNKLSSIASGAQVNLIETITVNGVAQAINNKTVALTIMTNAVDDLVNYYKKSETYTQSEVNALISAIPKFDVKVVDTLPTTDISNSTVYLLRTSETETGNLYTEYIYAEVTAGTYQWEKLGTQTLDLSDYVTTDELNTVLAGYVTATTLATELARYTDTTTLTGLLDNKVDKVTGKGLSTEDYTTEDKVAVDTIGNKVDKINGKGLSTEDYTTEEKTKLSGITSGAEPNVQSDWSVTDNTSDAFIKNKPMLGTASTKDVATAGNASGTQVVMGNDTRLTDARNAADVSAWAKADTKPAYTASEVGLGNVLNTGDSATPVANGTTKFTTGGAYTELNKKVDKEEGKGLSSNDFTDDDKTAILNSAIPSTSTSSPLTDSANGLVQGLTIYGQSEVVEGEIKSVGDDGLTVTTANSDNTLTTSAEFTTALPLRGVSDTVRDKLTCTAESKQVTKKCVEVDLSPTNVTWTLQDTNSKRKLYYTGLGDIIDYSDPFLPTADFTRIDVPSPSNLAEPYRTAVSPQFGALYVTLPVDVDISIMDGVSFVMVLAEPVTTPLTTAEISAFRGLRTFDSTTNVTITDEPEFELDYLKNTENGQAVANVQKDLQGQIDEVNSKTDILESKIDLLESKSEHFVYAYVIDHDDSNPATCVQPYYNTKYGCDNLLYTPAYMDYSTNKFNYGSWESFIKRIAKPCMLHYDGHVDYYLDPDDYNKKLDGGDSDIADMNYEGNVMVELERLYFKRWTANRKSYVIISDQKLDKSFKAFAHHDVNGKPAEYIYRAVYDGAYDGTRLRSISGIDYHNADALTIGKIMSNTTREEEMNYAKANNTSTEKGEGWFILHKAEWDYINDILVLIGMSTDTQTVFGRGRDSGYVSSTNTGIISTGTMDDKGLFWGENAGTGGVKVLGFENHWGNLMKSCAGWNLVNGEQKTKMTYGTEDYSADTGFNTDASGYPTTTPSTPSGTNGGYISNWITGESGFIPLVASGSALTYRTDGLWFVNNANCFALVGGFSGFGKLCGATAVSLHDPATYRGWSIGATLTYKTLA